MKKIISIAAMLLLLGSSIFSQGNKSVFFELGGNGLGFSINYDARFSKSENGFGFRAGIGYFPAVNTGDADIFVPSTPSMLTIPVGINHLAGKAPHYFESGLGITYVNISGSFSSDFWGYSEDASGSAVGFIPSIGYRYAKAGKGFQGRAVISPIIGSGGFAFWLGLSAGIKF